MVIVRAVMMADLEKVWELIGQATIGLTTLQLSKAQLRERIELSEFAFNRQTERPAGEPYVFVMEDLDSGKLVGLSCIFSKTGGYEPFYSYRRVTESSHCQLLEVSQTMEYLELTKIHDGPTEIGSLFLLPEFRGQGRGVLLSLVRFVFMAAHPNRFAETVIAEMRGVSDDEGLSPFWDAVGHHFFGIDYPDADRLSTIDKRFIEELMPRHPVYVCLLPESAQNVIGQVHPSTQPALALLQKQGFEVTDQVDIFDAGPVVHCRRDQIDAVRRTQPYMVGEIVSSVVGDRCILASCTPSFRAVLGVSSKTPAGGLRLDEATAKNLGVNVGDDVSRMLLDQGSPRK